MGHCSLPVDCPLWPEQRPEPDRAPCNHALCSHPSYLELYRLSVNPPHDIRHATHTDFLLIQPMADRESIGPSAPAILLLRKYHCSHSLPERIIFSLVGYLVVPHRFNKRLIFLPSVVTGISYETLNIMHRAAARVQFVLILLHSFTKVPYVDQLLRRVRTYRS